MIAAPTKPDPPVTITVLVIVPFSVIAVMVFQKYIYFFLSLRHKGERRTKCEQFPVWMVGQTFSTNATKTQTTSSTSISKSRFLLLPTTERERERERDTQARDSLPHKFFLAVVVSMLWAVSLLRRLFMVLSLLLATPRSSSFRLVRLVHRHHQHVAVHHHPQSSHYSTTTATITTTTTTTTTRRMVSSSSLSVSDFVKQYSLSNAKSIAIGNPAGDADSIISAIALAYIDSISNTTTTTTMLPIVSIPHVDLKTLRPETKYLLNLAQVDLDDLIAIDHPNLPTNVNVALVDHNALTVPNKPDWTVTQILDHHLDEGAHVDTCRERNVAFDESTSSALVASTCTLMVERYLQGSSSTTTTTTTTTLSFPPSIAILLLGVILLDSINLSTKAGKVTPRDEAAVNTLLSNTQWSDLTLPTEIVKKEEDKEQQNQDYHYQPDPTLLFDTLQNQKFSPEFWKSLSVRQALTLDYKSFGEGNTKFGISSILLPSIDFSTGPPQILKEAESLISEQELQVLGIMFFYMTNTNNNDNDGGDDDDDNIPKRELIVIGNKSSTMITERLVKYLLDNQTLELKQEYSLTDDNGVQQLVLLQQGNSKASRKQVAPLFMEFFSFHS